MHIFVGIIDFMKAYYIMVLSIQITLTENLKFNIQLGTRHDSDFKTLWMDLGWLAGQR